MSFQELAQATNRMPVYMVQLDLDNRISPWGVEQHIKGKAGLEQQVYPSIRRIDFAPSRMEPGSGFGHFSSISVTFDDFQIPGSDGTYFNSLIGANHPFYVDRPLRLFVGFYDEPFDISNFRERLYFIKKIDGPNSKGQVTITAQDVLTKLEKEESVLPLKTRGELQLSISDTFTGQVGIANNENFSPTGGVASLDGSEWVRYSGIVGLTDIVISERNVFGTEASNHDAGVPIRNAFTFENENVADLMRRIINDYSSLGGYIPDADWDTERDNYLLSELAYDGWVEPLSVKEAINRLCKQFSCSVWWDDELQEIRLRASGANLVPIARINYEDHILNVGENPKRDPSKAITRAWVWFGKKDYSAGDDAENYLDSYLYVNGDLEGPSGHDRVSEEVIYARSIPLSGEISAQKIATRIVEERGLGKFDHQFRVDIKDSVYRVGDIVEITSKRITNENGTPIPTNFVIIERDLISENTYQYEARIAGIDIRANFGEWAPDNLSDYSVETGVNREQYVFWCDDNDLMPNGDDPYLWL